MKIRVLIADKPFSIDIEATNEEVVRRAAKKINQQIEASRRRYDTTTFDHLAMAAFKISIENEVNKEKFKYSIERLEIEELAKTLEDELKV
ncbi:MAG: cell division protein ZapA [Mucinivorans sp.]